MTPPNFLDLTGQSFTRLTVLSRDTTTEVKNWTVRWVCQCSCGVIVSVPTRDLRSGHTRSCGCLSREPDAHSQLKHGGSRKGQRKPEYRIWCHMKTRCLSATCPDFPRYGGRGITICERWIASFTAFLEDMGERPSSKHTLERRKNNEPYCPENCYWADRLTQARNTRNNVFLTWNGETHCISEWSEIVSIHQGTLADRYRAGWSVEQILTRPPRRGLRPKIAQ